MREIYIGAGQSNMSGRGVLGNPVYDKISRIWNYCANGVWQNAPIDPVDSPMCQVDSVSADPDAAVGPLLSFANKLAELRNTDIGIVPGYTVTTTTASFTNIGADATRDWFWVAVGY